MYATSRAISPLNQMQRRLSSPLVPLLPHLLLPFFTRRIDPITVVIGSNRCASLLVLGSRMDHHQSADKEKESDQIRECCGKGACEFNAGTNRVSERLMPHILNLYASHATARDFEIYAANASFEDPLMCAHGVKQIKSAFYSLSKVFSESSIVEYNIKEKMESQGKYEILIDNKQSYKFMGRNIDMISLIRLQVVDGKVIRHEDWWDKKPLKNRDTVNFPLVGRLIEAARRGSMMVTHAMMGFGKDHSA
ncbi:hypothetical protein MLD38_011260 [Melastoma candidum]|uniref:Uncharacterized protein n=1 Tax=Melastoma candidum TaxID=119954 RepID=A0ACB9R3U1_9MYRT|nr:hypothetical protein MLD38_011260 [Melastoma candidum]